MIVFGLAVSEACNVSSKGTSWTLFNTTMRRLRLFFTSTTGVILISIICRTFDPFPYDLSFSVCVISSRSLRVRYSPTGLSLDFHRGSVYFDY